MADTVKVKLNADWVWDKKYSKGEVITIPKDVYESTVTRFPEFFSTDTKPDVKDAG